VGTVSRGIHACRRLLARHGRAGRSASTTQGSIVTSASATNREAIHPFHAAVLAGAFPLFLGTLFADWAYYASHEIQWSDFASWLVIGALVFATLALLCAATDLFRGRGGLAYCLVLVAAWLSGFFDALHHARDAWAIMPGALLLSLLAAALSLGALWLGYARPRPGVAP
jgi:uncharacterized membrane protein